MFLVLCTNNEDISVCALSSIETHTYLYAWFSSFFCCLFVCLFVPRRLKWIQIYESYFDIILLTKKVSSNMHDYSASYRLYVAFETVHLRIANNKSNKNDWHSDNEIFVRFFSKLQHAKWVDDKLLKNWLVSIKLIYRVRPVIRELPL